MLLHYSGYAPEVPSLLDYTHMPDLERDALGYFARPHTIPNHQEGRWKSV